MRRRDFITILGGTAMWPMAARAQQPMPVVGFLGSETPDVFASRVRAFRAGLGEAGFVEGRNVAIQFQWAGGNYNLLRTMADELVRQKVAVLVSAGSTPAVLAAKAATATIPIPVVFYVGSDPVAYGLVASLNRPGGNLTGVYGLNTELLAKRIELLHEAVPAAASIAGLINPTNRVASVTEGKTMEDAARSLGLEMHILHASSERDFEPAFAKLHELGAGALVLSSDAYFQSRSDQLGALSLRHRVPAVSVYREFAAAGGLMSYGGSITDFLRVVGAYTGRILNGEKPADLPVQQSTKVELTVNLKTAKTLGLALSLPLLGRADEVIE